MSYTSSADMVSYGLGRQFADQLSADPFEGLNPQAMSEGLLDAFAGKESPIDPLTMQRAFQEINDIMQAKQAEQAKVAAAEGEAFLAENAKKDSVVVLESGLQYEIMVEGDGEKPSETSTVSTHYHGTLVDGTVFDSSVERGQPAQFPVNRVIAGWTEALQLMPVGSKWRLYIPYQLAYGEQGSGGAIGPYQTLIFDVELLEIVE